MTESGVGPDGTQVRDFEDIDSDDVDRVAVAAFTEFEERYDDWPVMAAELGTMSRLAEVGEVIVAETGGHVCGAVAYIPPHQVKADYFDPGWPVIRMLVVDPAYRGAGIGRALTEACIDRARRDRSDAIALHTSPIMTVALPMYRRMGFRFARDAPPIHGVAYAVYVKSLKQGSYVVPTGAPTFTDELVEFEDDKGR